MLASSGKIDVMGQKQSELLAKIKIEVLIPSVGGQSSNIKVRFSEKWSPACLNVDQNGDHLAPHEAKYCKTSLKTLSANF